MAFETAIHSLTRTMTIHLDKFGKVLTGRDAGREAIFAFAPTLAAVGAQEDVWVSFEGVHVLTPSWADEFLVPLARRFGAHLHLSGSTNSSINTTLALLEQIHGIRFQRDGGAAIT
jgi:hypothetical protein